MRTRVWVTVLVSVLTLVAASTARFLFTGLIERLSSLHWPAVVLGLAACLTLCLSLAVLSRAWFVRKTVVRVLARCGIADSVIARRVSLSQDSVALLRAVSGGKHGHSRQAAFSGSGIRSHERYQKLRSALSA